MLLRAEKDEQWKGISQGRKAKRCRDEAKLCNVVSGSEKQRSSLGEQATWGDPISQTLSISNPK